MKFYLLGLEEIADGKSLNDLTEKFYQDYCKTSPKTGSTYDEIPQFFFKSVCGMLNQFWVGHEFIYLINAIAQFV